MEWPTQADLRKALAHSGVPRVLLVTVGTPPPVLGVDEGWMWSDATDNDIDECADAVLARMRSAETVERGSDGTWSHAGCVFRLPLQQARLMEELAAHRGTPVPRRRLIEVAWPGQIVRRCAIDVAIGRLRDRLVGTGLCIRSARGIGYELA